jgi:hypothetical protein
VVRTNNQINSNATTLSDEKVPNPRSKYRGVRWYRRTSRWVVQVRINGQRKHVGYFDSEEVAARAYCVALEKFQTEVEIEKAKIAAAAATSAKLETKITQKPQVATTTTTTSGPSKGDTITSAAGAASTTASALNTGIQALKEQPKPLLSHNALPAPTVGVKKISSSSSAPTTSPPTTSSS